MTPADLLADFALRTSTAGDNVMTPALLTSWEILDPEPLKKGALKDLFVEPDKNSFDEMMYIKPELGASSLAAVKIDVSPYYTKRGRILFRPPFFELVLATKKYFSDSDPDAESFIRMTLGQSRELAATNTEAVRISHQAARWRRLFGTDAVVSLRLKELIAHLIINSPDTGEVMDIITSSTEGNES
jgi:hypothetical protein